MSEKRRFIPHDARMLLKLWNSFIRFRISDELGFALTQVELEQGKRMNFLFHIDLVIEGGCGGKDPMEEGLDFWMPRYVAATNPKGILFLPTCCGQFPSLVQERLKEMHPGIDMYFPALNHRGQGDLQEHVLPMCKLLYRAKIIG